MRKIFFFAVIMDMPVWPFFLVKKLFIKNNYKTVRVNLSILKLNVEDTNFVI